MIKAIVFDMDDTLYPEHDYVKSGFKAVDAELQKLNVYGFFEKSVELFDSGQRTKIFNLVLDYLGVEYKNEFINELVSIYRNHLPEIKLFEDAKITLEKMHKEYPLGLISDGYLEAQTKKIEALELHKFVKEILLTDQLGRENWKPSEVPYNMMSKALNVKNHELVYIGDNINKDFITAKKLGWLTIHISRYGAEYSKIDTLRIEYQADFKVSSLLEIDSIINKYDLGSE